MLMVIHQVKLVGGKSELMAELVIIVNRVLNDLCDNEGDFLFDKNLFIATLHKFLIYKSPDESLKSKTKRRWFK